MKTISQMLDEVERIERGPVVRRFIDRFLIPVVLIVALALPLTHVSLALTVLILNFMEAYFV